MFDFLKRLRGLPEEAEESQRARFERLVADLNDAIAELPEKPAVTVMPVTGGLAFEMPEQFPDEALALPKPEDEEGPEADAAASADSAEGTEAEEGERKPG